jgi:dTDP-4-dehydrorhamnose reductase
LELFLLGATIFLAIRIDALSQRLARLEQRLGETEEQAAAQQAAARQLDSRKLQATFDLNLPHWQGGVERMLTEINRL